MGGLSELLPYIVAEKRPSNIAASYNVKNSKHEQSIIIKTLMNESTTHYLSLIHISEPTRPY